MDGADWTGSCCWQLEKASHPIHWPAPLRNRKRGARAACLDTTHNTYIFGTPYIRRGGVGAQRTRTGLGDNGGSGEKLDFYCQDPLTRTVRLATAAKEEFHLHLDSITWAFFPRCLRAGIVDPGALLVTPAADHFLPIGNQP